MRKICWLIILACAANIVALAQQGTSTGSVARSRSVANNNFDRNAFVAPDDVAVDEFVNYHKHRLPLPKVGQAVALDVRWGNDAVSDEQPEAVLQIGFTTAEVNDNADLRPVNLALVIDKSGSMAEANKMVRVKQALREMIGQLRRSDTVSIVVFDSEAEVLRAAQAVGDGDELRRAIDSIRPDGSTNLNAGLLLGYREAMKNYSRKTTNRVILLTDGIANQGVTAPDEIARNSQKFNAEGIDLSTIGVGADLDTNLLRTLAKSGRGLYHFVADAEDINKVFVAEVQSLLSPVAKKVELSVDYDDDLTLEQIYGYAPRQRRNSVQINLDDMNNGLTQVALLRFRAKNNRRELKTARVRLSYFDFKRQKQVEETQEVSLQNSDDGRAPKLLADVEVKKNYTIALLAQGISEMTAAAKRNDYKTAQNKIESAIAAAYVNFPTMTDVDVRRVLDIAQNYQTQLRAQNRRGAE